MRIARILSFIILYSIGSTAQADIMVLVHGYNGDADDWRRSGIAEQLHYAGWRDGGVVYSVASKPTFSSPKVTTANKFFTVQLPSEYPLLFQSKILATYLHSINTIYPDERIVLVGHSAGGVIARGTVVNAAVRLPVTQLITIASPNLGTDAAMLGVLTANSPLSMFTPLMGAGTINRSEQLYRDLSPEEPGSLLFVLNRQQHPLIEYISVVRKKTFGVPGDLIVSEESQHLEYVFALRNIARSVIAGYGHRLQEQDANVILRLVSGSRSL